MGFSAGGHLASTIATHLTGDELPAFQVLFYPVITMDSHYTHAGSRQNLLGDNPSDELVALYSNELQVKAETPPAYLCWANDDSTVKPTNSIKYRTALKSAGVSYTYKTFSSGGHGFGFSSSFAYHNQMLTGLKKWLNGLNDVITRVGEIQASNTKHQSDDAVYDLSGRQLTNSQIQRGIYIKADKKVIIP